MMFGINRKQEVSMFGINRQQKRADERESKKKIGVKAVKVMEIYLAEDKNVILQGSIPKDPQEQFYFMGRIMTALANLALKAAKAEPESKIIKPQIIMPKITS